MDKTNEVVYTASQVEAIIRLISSALNLENKIELQEDMRRKQ